MAPAPRKGIGNPSIHFLLAVLLLVLGVAWFLAPGQDAVLGRVVATVLLASGTVMVVRGVRSMTAPGDPKRP